MTTSEKHFFPKTFQNNKKSNKNILMLYFNTVGLEHIQCIYYNTCAVLKTIVEANGVEVNIKYQAARHS